MSAGPALAPRRRSASLRHTLIDPARRAVALKTPPGLPRRDRYGPVLFLLYLVVYAGFVLSSAFAADFMASDAPGGLNFALAYGLGLIVGAVLLALVYAALRRDAGRGGPP